MHGRSRGFHQPRLYDFLLFLMTRGREGRYRRQLLELAGIEEGKQVLDIGCGTGTTSIAAWRRVRPAGTVVGADVSPQMIAAARRKAARAGVHALRFEVCDATALPFADASFDVALLTTVLHMVPPEERGMVLREAARVLRPGGRVLLVDYGGSERHGVMAKHGLHRAFDLDAMQPLLVPAGLTDAGAGALGWLGLRYLLARKA